MQTNGIHPGDVRLASAIAAGVPIAGTPAQARELVAQENEAAARAARTDAWLAKARASATLHRVCQNADRDRYWRGKPGVAAFDAMDSLMTPAARAQAWARTELSQFDHDAEDAGKIADHLDRIAKGLRGEMPSDVHIGSRRGCCGATLIENETEDGTEYECALCGKEVMP